MLTDKYVKLQIHRGENVMNIDGWMYQGVHFLQGNKADG